MNNEQHNKSFGANSAGTAGELVAGTMRGYRAWNVTAIIDVDTSDSLFHTGGLINHARYSHNYSAAYEFRLHSVSAKYTWINDQVEAHCTKPMMHQHMIEHMVADDSLAIEIIMCDDSACAAGRTHKAPVESCTCGIYGWYTPQFALTQHTGPIIGVTENTGRLQLGTRGFRAQRSKVVAISLAPMPVISDIKVIKKTSGGLGLGSAGMASYPREFVMGQLRRAYPRVKIFDDPVKMLRRYLPDLDTPRNLGIDVDDGAKPKTLPELINYAMNPFRF